MIVWVATFTLTLVAGTTCWTNRVEVLWSWARGSEMTKLTVAPLVNPLPVMVIGAPPSKSPARPDDGADLGHRRGPRP